jgi:hypothetical protein
MDQILTGTVQGRNTIVFDSPLAMPDGQTVEVVLREPQSVATPVAASSGHAAQSSPPSWWTTEDDRILNEVYLSRKHSTRSEAAE